MESYVSGRFWEWVKDYHGPQSEVTGRRESRTLSVEQLDAFVDAAEKIVPVRYPEIVTLAYTGMRRGALYGLNWDDLDFDDRIIFVTRSFSNGSLSDEPKTYERRVPMNPRVQDALCRHHERLRVQEHPGLDKGIVFPSNNGKRRYGSSLADPCKKAAKVAGIEQHVSPQVLRNTFNSRLVEDDVEKVVLQSIMGHSTNQMTEWYSEISMSAKREAIQVIMSDSSDWSPQNHQAV